MIVNGEYYGLSFGIDYSKYVFRLYNPLTYELDDLNLPEQYAKSIFDLINQSRQILGKRNFDEICFAVNALHEMHSIIFYGDHKDDCEPKQLAHNSEPFLNYMSIFNISQLDEFPDATWFEFYAASALISIAVILDSLEVEDKAREQLIEIESILNAAKAIAYAECIPYMALDIDKQVKNKISIQNRNAVNIRHAPKNAIKNEFVEYFKNNLELNPNLKQADASRRFYRIQPKEKKKYFRDEKQAERSLTEHLRKVLKAQK